MKLFSDYHSHPQGHRVQRYTQPLLQPWIDSARARGLTASIAAEGDGPGSGNGDQTGIARSSPKRQWLCRRSVMPEHIVRTPTEARASSKEGVVRYVLAISLVLVVILFMVAYKFSV